MVVVVMVVVPRPPDTRPPSRPETVSEAIDRGVMKDT